MSEPPSTLPAFDGIPDPSEDLPLPAFVRPGADRVGRTRAELRRARVVTLVVALAWFTGQIGYFGVRHELHRVPWVYLLAFSVGPFAAAAFSFLVALHAGRFGLGVGARTAGVLSLLGPLAFLALAWLYSPAYPGAPLGEGGSTFACLGFGLLWMFVPLLLAGVALKSSFVGAALPRSALIGTAAGLASAAISTLHCPFSGALHVGLGHGGAAIVGTVAGALALARLARA